MAAPIDCLTDIGKAIIATAGVATATGVAALTFTSPVSAEVIDQYIEVPQCEQPQTQLCTPIPTVSVNTGAVLVQFTANQNHCASMIAHIIVDGRRMGGRAVGPGQTDGGHFFPDLTPGTHTIGVQAEGIEGGCNTGFVSAWGGTLQIQTYPEAFDDSGTPSTPPGHSSGGGGAGGD